MSNVSPAPGFSRPGQRPGLVRCPPALTAPLMPLLSHLPRSGLGPGPGNSQGLEAAEATEHAPMHRFQLVPRQHQLLQAGRSVEGTLSHLLDPVVTQVSGRRGRTGQDAGREWRDLQPAGDSKVPPGPRTGWWRLHLGLPDVWSSAPVPQEAGSPAPPWGVDGRTTCVKQTV